MKFTKAVGLVLLMAPVLSFANNKNYPCSGASGAYHTNSDETVGGFVASTATVDPSVTIAPEASVCERATVIEGAIISGRAVITGKATVRGIVEVSEEAKVYGEAYVINNNGNRLLIDGQAHVFGQAFVQGSVIITDASEVYGWGKVLDYAQLFGESQVCGNGVVSGFSVLQDDSTYCNQ